MEVAERLSSLKLTVRSVRTWKWMVLRQSGFFFGANAMFSRAMLDTVVSGRVADLERLFLVVCGANGLLDSLWVICCISCIFSWFHEGLYSFYFISIFIYIPIFSRIPKYIIYPCQFCSFFARSKGVGVMEPPRNTKMFYGFFNRCEDAPKSKHQPMKVGSSHPTVCLNKNSQQHINMYIYICNYIYRVKPVTCWEMVLQISSLNLEMGII